MPPGMSRSRSFTRLTTRVGLPHLGQSVLLVVSITFLRSAVFAILAMSSPVQYFPAGCCGPMSTWAGVKRDRSGWARLARDAHVLSPRSLEAASTAAGAYSHLLYSPGS